jgi:hypothetical protein
VTSATRQPSPDGADAGPWPPGLTVTAPEHDAAGADGPATPTGDTGETAETGETVVRARKERGVLRRAVGAFAGWWATAGSLDTAICLLYASYSMWLTRELWANPATRALAANVNDQALVEWFLAHGVLAWTGDFGLVTHRLNAPDGVNLMSNASHILHGVIMAPVTVLFGAPVSFTLLVALNLAATAAGWYLLLARGLRLNRAGALLAGAFTGFAPAMISQSNSHLHMTAQWLVPPIVWCVLRLTRVRRPRSVALTGVGLGLLVSAQVLLGEEVLYLTALTLLLFVIAYALRRRSWALEVAPRFVAGMAIATGIAVVLLAYPLWVQFAGPQHTPNAPFGPEYFIADLASYTVYSPLSIAGLPEAGRLAANPTELNTFLGLPLLLVVLACMGWRWRAPNTPALGFAIVVMFLLSLGPTVILNGHRFPLPSLYKTIAKIPVINGALPTRYALALVPLIAVLLAYALDAALRQDGYARVLVPVAVIAALVPASPKPLAVTTRPPVPEFITSGAWRECMPPGGVLVPVPLPTPAKPDAMRWPAAANVAFSIPEGFFIGPYGPEGHSSIGTYSQPTSALLRQVADTGEIPVIDDAIRTQARADLAFWGAHCVALAHVPQEQALRITLDQLYGPGVEIRDTWTWKVG